MRKSVACIFILLLLVSLGMFSCTEDPFYNKEDVTPSRGNRTEQVDEDGEWIPMAFDFNAAGMNTPKVRGLTEEQENEITTGKVRVLVFNGAGETTKFAYEAKVTGVIPNTNDKKQTGQVKLLVKNSPTPQAPQIFVMLANVEPDTPTATDFTDKNVDQVMKLFTFTIPSEGWKGGDLPMWGKLTATVNHSEGANPQIGGTMELIRAVARIDVGLNLTKNKEVVPGASEYDEKPQELEGITMTSVKFYNMNNGGYVAPQSANVASTGTNVTAPTVLTATPFDIEKFPQENLLLRSVYVPEAYNNPTDATHSANGQTLPEDKKNYLKRPYMVVGLKGADKSNTNKETFFRIDFLKKDGTEAKATYKYLHLLRNYRYLVNITNVGGPGYDTEKDAQEGPAANIMYNVVVWNESEMSNVVYDGQYMLGVKKDDFTFYKAKGGTVSTTVQTSWPEGFEVKGLPEWIKVKSIEPSGDDTSDTGEKIVTFEVLEDTKEVRKWPDTENPDAENPEGAYIQAGRMRWNLSFTQSDKLEVKIEIFSDQACKLPLQFIELDERGKETPANEYTVGSKTFYVRVSSGAKITSVIDNSGEKFIFSSGSTTDKELPPFKAEEVEEVEAGLFKFTVTADPMLDENNPFERKQNKYLFTAAQLDQTAEAELTISQIEYSIVFYSDPQLTHRMKDDAGVFFMDGKDNSFYVKSNIPYTVWLDNQTIDESVRNSENAYQDGQAKLPMVTHYYDQGGALQKINYEPNKWIKVKEQHEATWSGSEMKFKVANDMKEPKIIYGHVKWVAGTPLKSVAWKFPMFTGDNHDAVTMATTNFISAYTLPEANSYPITLGTGGVLIPLSRINTAAQFYDAMFDSPYRFTESDYSNSKDETAKTDPTENWAQYKSRNKLNTLDKDDNVSLEVLWTDVPSVTEAGTIEERNPIQVDGTAPLKLLTTIVRYGERYVYLLPGNDAENNYGNLVFGVRSSIKERVDNGRGVEFNPAEDGKKALLWSFHIMLYRKGAIPVNINNINQPISEKSLTYYDRSDMPEYMADWGADIVSWPYDLGAFFFPENTQGSDNGIRYRDKRYRRIGLCYQFGRKDPFPRWKNTEDAPSRLVGHKGKIVTFIFHQGKTISMRESIENPMVMVGNTNGHEWLTEGCRTTDKSIQRGACSTFGYYGLWGGAPAVGGATTAGQRKEIARNTTKTVFDPCPYGFSIPTPGYASTLVFDARGKVNQKRFRPNFALSAMGTQMEYYNTYSGNDNTLFSIYDGIFAPGEGVWAVSTTYLKQTHYPVILMGFDSGTMNERYQNDILRSSPVLVRPFLNPAESDWEAYIRR